MHVEEPVSGSIIQSIRQGVEDRFKKRWGFLDLAIQVAKETMTPYFQLVNEPAIAVLTLAGYLKDKVELIELKNSK